MPKLRGILILVLFFFFFASPINAQTPAISVNPSQITGQVSPTFFGLNITWPSHGMEFAYQGETNTGYEYADEVRQKIKELNVSTIRFPGGCAADSYSWVWKKGKTYDLEPPPPFNKWFSYGLGIDQYIELLQFTGADAYWQINMQDGHLIQDKGKTNCVKLYDYPGTISEARDLALYFKEKLPGRTIWWELGNEPWDVNWTIRDYVTRGKQYAQAIREVYPEARFVWSIKFWQPDRKVWIDYLAANAGDYLDAVALHDYYRKEEDFNIDDVNEYLRVNEAVKERFNHFRSEINATGKNIEIDTNEFGIWFTNNPLMGTVAHSLALAQLYQQYLNYGVSFTHSGNGGGVSEYLGGDLTYDQMMHQGTVLVTGGGPWWERERKNYPPIATNWYYVQKLLADHIGTEMVSVNESVDMVDVSVSKKSNTIYTLIINKNNAIKHLPIQIGSDINLRSPARAYVVGKGSASHTLNELGALEIRNGNVSVSGNTVDFYAEPYSVSVVEVDLVGTNSVDLNGDGVINLADLARIISVWGQTGKPEDINGDSIVGLADLQVVLTNWGR